MAALTSAGAGSMPVVEALILIVSVLAAWLAFSLITWALFFRPLFRRANHADLLAAEQSAAEREALTPDEPPSGPDRSNRFARSPGRTSETETAPPTGPPAA